MNGVLVILEYRGALEPYVLGGPGRRTADRRATNQPLMAAVAGSSLDDAAADLAGKPLARAFAVRHALLDEYTADGFVAAFEQLITSARPTAGALPPHLSGSRLRASPGRPLRADA